MPRTKKAVEEVDAIKIKVKKADNQEHEVVVKNPIIKNSQGEDVLVVDYFFAPEGETSIAPPFFNKSFGLPVDREDLVERFNKVFNPEDNFVFLKSMNKEVYGVLIPLKYTEIGEQEDSILGDCQYHAVSFVLDGSVNYAKLDDFFKKVATRVGYSKK